MLKKLPHPQKGKEIETKYKSLLIARHETENTTQGW